MTLKDILEENSVKAISKKTMISEENLEAIVAEDFSHLTKSKAFGFLSILEREFDIETKSLKEKALSYYETHVKEESANIALPRLEEKKGRSKWFILLMLGLLAYASWYFFTQFDKKRLNTLIPFGEEKIGTSAPTITETPKEEMKTEESLSITNALTSTQTDATGAQTDIVVASIEPQNVEIQRAIVKPVPVTVVETTRTTGKTHTLIRSKKIVLLPEKKLWFGLIDMETGKRKHFSISKKYEIEVKDKSWLVATSVAQFAFINQNETQDYNDGKVHYFKVNRTGVEELSKAEYLKQGGYKKW